MEESTHSQIAPFAIEYKLLLRFIQARPRNLQRDTGLLGVTLQVGQERTILRFRPGIDRALSQGFGFVGDDSLKIEIDGIAEPLASRACSIRIVEREKPRLRLFVAQVAVLAFKAMRETQLPCWFVVLRRNFEDYFARLAVRRLDRIHHASTAFGRNRQTIDQNKHGRRE